MFVYWFLDEKLYPCEQFARKTGKEFNQQILHLKLNLLKPNDIYVCRTAALTSRLYILNIYSTNIHTKYFKNAA